MTETDLIMSMNFNNTNLFIMFTNPEDASKLAGAMASTTWGGSRTSNMTCSISTCPLFYTRSHLRAQRNGDVNFSTYLRVIFKIE